MTNHVADKLEAAANAAPFVIEKERYQMAVDEIRRLQDIVDQLIPEDDDDGEIRIYAGDPWHADETLDCVRIFHGNLQIIKAAKRNTPYAEYWPEPVQLTWMLAALNQAEKVK